MPCYARVTLLARICGRLGGQRGLSAHARSLYLLAAEHGRRRLSRQQRRGRGFSLQVPQATLGWGGSRPPCSLPACQASAGRLARSPKQKPVPPACTAYSGRRPLVRRPATRVVLGQALSRKCCESRQQVQRSPGGSPAPSFHPRPFLAAGSFSAAALPCARDGLPCAVAFPARPVCAPRSGAGPPPLGPAAPASSAFGADLLPRRL